MIESLKIHMSDQPPRKARRSLPDLSGLYDSIQEPELAPLSAPMPPAAPLPGPVGTAPDAPQPAVAQSPRLPEGLADFLPPDLWRKLSSGGELRAGVLINALDRLRSLLYNVSTYLPADLVQEKLNKPVPGLVSGRMLEGCLLFCDVSGFTALSERLAGLGPRGAETLTGVINQYFTTMIEILSWSGGTLVKFAGDAALVYFPVQAGGMHAHWAARTGLRMLRAMQRFASLETPGGPVSLKMKIGMAAGTFLAASIGSARRMEYALLGPAVSDTMQAESCAAAGRLVANRAAADLLAASYRLDPVRAGFLTVENQAEASLDDFEIRPEKRRARSAIPWGASSEEVLAEIDAVLHQIQALIPYLAAELVERIVAHASQRQVQSEFRSTAVLFCSFSGPEALVEQWGARGAERITGLLSAYFNEVNEIITRYGGIVSRIDPYSKGTKLMALFGAPVAHEDDAQRAVSAGLAMNAAVQALNQRWAKKLARHLPEGHAGVLIEQRTGITLGSTYAGQVGASTRREYTVMGDVVNLAARLMSAAAPGQILISAAVEENAGSSFVTRALPPVRVKGKSQPVPLFAVDGPRDDTLLQRIRARGPLTGRAAELARCQAVLNQGRGGQGMLLALSGPAGIGKSHLADALLREAQEAGWQLLAFQCREYLSGTAYACWGGLVRGMAGITSIDHPLIQKEKLDRLAARCALSPAHWMALAGLLGLPRDLYPPEQPAAGEGADLFELVRQKKASRRASGLDVLSQLEDAASAPGAPPGKSARGQEPQPQDREDAARQAALAALLSAETQQAPLLVFFEDAHCMDAASRACLRGLSRAARARPLVFLLAGRIAEEDLPEGAESVVLQPFSPEETYALTASILVGGLAGMIHEQSSGSPLFVEEISRWIQRTRKIGAEDLKEVLQSSDILQKLVLSSLESLPEGQREIARLASVVGNAFQRSEVECLMEPAPDSVTLSASLRGLVQARLVRASEAGVDPRYSFVQPLFRGILYNSLPLEQRRALHGRLADFLSAQSSQKNQSGRRRELRNRIAAFLEGGPGSGAAEVLAYHYEMAGRWLEAACQQNELAEQALPGEPERAQAHYQQALALLERCGESANSEPAESAACLERVRAQSGLGDLAARRGDLPAAGAAYEAAAQTSASLTGASFPPGKQARLAARLALALPALGKTAQAQEHLERAIRAESAAEAEDSLLWALRVLAAWLGWRSGISAEALAERAAAARALLPARGTQALRGRAVLAEISGDWQPALEAYTTLGDVDGLALIRARWGDALLAQSCPQAAVEQYAHAAAAWAESGTACGQALACYRQAEAAADPRAGLALLEEALAWLGKSAPELQEGPRQVIQRALALRANPRRGAEPWLAWEWQPFEDLYRLRVMLAMLE